MQDWQRSLLAIAHRVASAMPSNPHIKTRSRLQESVAVTAFRLGMPDEALAYVDSIEDWRRGAGYADHAAYLAEHGGPRVEIDQAIAKATRIADAVLDAENPQAWRRDRIRAKIARTLLRLGDDAAAKKVGVGLEASEAGLVQSAHAATLSADEARRSLEGFDQTFETGDLETVRNMLGACIALLDAHYGDEELRAAFESRIRGGYSKLPKTLRMDYLLQASSIALEHQDLDKARELAALAASHLDAGQYLVDDEVQAIARIAAARGGAGDRQTAKTELLAALQHLRSEKAKLPEAQHMFDLERAATLRALAEGFAACGDGALAQSTYADAVEAGVLNPNSRPRAEALVSTCCSMAALGLEPSPELRQRIATIASGMGDPW